MVTEPAEILSADFTIDVVAQLDVDLLVIQAGIFQGSFPTPERSNRVNPLNQSGVTSCDGGNVERSAARMEPLDFANDAFLRCRQCHRRMGAFRTFLHRRKRLRDQKSLSDAFWGFNRFVRG